MEELKEELGNKYDEIMYQINLELLKGLEVKTNIIKEASEKMNTLYNAFMYDEEYRFDEDGTSLLEIKEILDKENK